uniref:hypothetical protein n=1 Tax=Salmonella sp. s51228 TaxID=3159652 RepID=UPI003980DF27
QDDKSLLTQFQKITSFYEDELLPCESFQEYCDVIEILDLVTAPDTFISDTLNLIPKPPTT